MMAVSQASSGAVLEETFYIFSKKKTVYRVRLTEKGLNLQKESNGSTKTEAILLSDIVGCRCVRSRRKSESCVCRPSVGSGSGSSGNRKSASRKSDVAPSYVDDNSSEQDENDLSAYLHIYAYVMKKRRGRVKSDPQQPNGKRERTTITLRFRSFDRYEENLREAQRWRVAIKCLMRNKPVPKSVLCNGDAYEPGLNEGRIGWGPEGTPEGSPVGLGGGGGGGDGDGGDDGRRLLVLLNPKSGPGKAREIFQRRVVPVLTEAEIPYDLHVTKHAGDARHLMRSRDLSKWSSIVVVGGDGLLFEVLNGMFERPDWEAAIAIPVAVVPGGSGNGLAKSICYYSGEPYDQNPVLLSSLNIVKGQPLPMDLARVETKSQIMFSFLSVGWGFLADIDIESERLRAMGGQRFTIWSVARLIGLRTYTGRLSYLPVPGHQPIISPDHKGGPVPLPRSISQSAPRGNRDLDIVDEADDRKLGVFRSRSYNEDLGNGGSIRERFGSVSSRSSMGDGLADDPDGVVGRPRLDSFYSVASRKSTFYSAAASSYLSAVGSSLSVSSLECDGNNGGGVLPPARMYGPASRLPSLTQPVPSDWKVIEGDFVMVHASYQSHIGSDALFAPNSKLADGIIWLLVVRAGITRAQLLQFLLGLSSGTHLKCPLVEMIPVRAFRLEPKDSNSPTRGHVTVDGELVDYGPLQVELVPSIARVLSR